MSHETVEGTAASAVEPAREMTPDEELAALVQLGTAVENIAAHAAEIHAQIHALRTHYRSRLDFLTADVAQGRVH